MQRKIARGNQNRHLLEMSWLSVLERLRSVSVIDCKGNLREHLSCSTKDTVKNFKYRNLHHDDNLHGKGNMCFVLLLKI